MCTGAALEARTTSFGRKSTLLHGLRQGLGTPGHGYSRRKMFRLLWEGIHRIAKAETQSNLAYDTIPFFRSPADWSASIACGSSIPAPLENSTYNTFVSSSTATYPSSIGEFGSLTDSPFNTTTVLVPDPPPKATSAKSALVNRYLAK